MGRMYVPLLAAKRAEWAALARLTSDSGPILPLLCIPPVPTRYSAPIDPDDWIRHFLNEAGKHWGGRPLMVDGHHLRRADHQPLAGDAYRHIADWSTAVGITPLPVVTPHDDHETLGSAAYMAALVGGGSAIRLQAGDIFLPAKGDDTRLRQDLDRLLAELGLEPGQVDVVVDLEQLPLQEQAGNVVTHLRFLFPSLPYLHDWRTMALASTSAPLRIDDRFNAPPVKDPIPRREWQIWSSLLSIDLPRHPDFGDYAGFSAAPPTETGRTRHPSLRYTTLDGRQLLARRRSAPGQGLKAFADVCLDVMASPHYLGAAFSWGDREIQRRAGSRDHPGNAQTWREIAIEHHIKAVLHQLTTQIPPASAPVAEHAKHAGPPLAGPATRGRRAGGAGPRRSRRHHQLPGA